ncbi:MAG: hypothetical protein M0Z89_07975 [Nitrospiraceae bacterium]|nr:hypothetical protein [Nitrospiraceae bacterium]
MNIWKRVVVDMEKGAKKTAAVAATFAERVRAEVNIVRLRIRIDEVHARIAEIHQTIGRKIVDLKKKNVLPKATDQLLNDEDIVAVLAELVDREQEIEELKKGIKDIHADFQSTVKHTEDSIA